VTDADLLELFRRCSNRGRWGDDDERGTLNLIGPAKVVEAARLVQTGHVVSIARPLLPGPGALGTSPVTHRMLLDGPHPSAALDHLGITPHDPEVTHLDAVTHVFWEGHAYNGRSIDGVLSARGLAFGSIHAARNGVHTRGVLLDVVQQIRVGSGDALLLHVGRELREAADPRASPIVRAGLHASALEWLHERGIAVFGGDCTERMPYPSERFSSPLHHIGLVSMGLCLLDATVVGGLFTTCRELDRWEFLLSCVPLDVPGATGSPVNPVCVF
jgi:kynurenine formamidase